MLYVQDFAPLPESRQGSSNFVPRGDLLSAQQLGERLHAFYRKWNPSHATAEYVSNVVAQYAEEQGRLEQNLQKKYGEGLHGVNTELQKSFGPSLREQAEQQWGKAPEKRSSLTAAEFGALELSDPREGQVRTMMLLLLLLLLSLLLSPLLSLLLSLLLLVLLLLVLTATA